MKKVWMMVCAGLISCMLIACGDEGTYEEYDEEVYSDEQGTEDSESSEINLADEVAAFDEVYAGAYGDKYEIVLAFDWDENAQNGLVMIIPNGTKEMEYFNVGEMSGDIGSKQTITGLSEYPFTFTVTDYTEDGSEMEITFDDGGVTTVNMQEASYLADKCQEMGMY